MSIPQSVSQEALIALQHIRDGANTTKLLAERMDESMSVVGNLRMVLVHFGAIRQCGRLRNGSKVFEPIPGWVPPIIEPEPPPECTVELERCWPVALALPRGTLRGITHTTKE